jgi:cell division protein FtsW
MFNWFKNTESITPPSLYDRLFLLVVVCLLAMGILMVASASMAIAEKQYQQPFYFLFKQLVYLGIGFVAVLIIVRIPTSFWRAMTVPMTLLALALLIAVLIPHIGRSVNGSRRWISFGFISLQVSEYVKMSIVLFIAGFLVRREDEIRTKISGFVKPMALYGMVAVLLLLEPDFGATAVIGCTILGMMFLAGVRLWQFIVLISLVAVIFVILVISAPYRMHRLTSFVDPWANAFGSGYQLTQSLIAFGRGGWFGTGLGNSVQKLFYLPEAHTDFLFAVLAEELGLIVVLFLIVLYGLLIWRIMRIGRNAQLRGNTFNAYVSYGFALWLGMQVFVNMGVNSGMLPTKGLTLPLISYGGSSLLIDCIAIGILLRIDYENRLQLLGLSEKKLRRGAH